MAAAERQNFKPLGIALIVFSTLLVAVALAHYFRLSYWMAPPAEKMAIAWADDMRLLENSKKLPKQWSEIREVAVRADTSVIQDWLKNLTPPINRNPNGNYKLETFLVFWIDGYRYGTVVQYHLVDLRNQNTVWEDGRTFKLGFVY